MMSGRSRSSWRLFVAVGWSVLVLVVYAWNVGQALWREERPRLEPLMRGFSR